VAPRREARGLRVVARTREAATWPDARGEWPGRTVQRRVTAVLPVETWAEGGPRQAPPGARALAEVTRSAEVRVQEGPPEGWRRVDK